MSAQAVALNFIKYEQHAEWNSFYIYIYRRCVLNRGHSLPRIHTCRREPFKKILLFIRNILWAYHLPSPPLSVASCCWLKNYHRNIFAYLVKVLQRRRLFAITYFSWILLWAAGTALGR